MRPADRPGHDDREYGRCGDRHGAVRATMPNADELLWPGTLVQVPLIFREEEAVTVPPLADTDEPGRIVRLRGRQGVAESSRSRSRGSSRGAVLKSGLERRRTGRRRRPTAPDQRHARVAAREDKAGS